MAKNGWLKDQFDEVRRDLDKWDKSRLNAARKEVNAIGSKLATSSNGLSTSVSPVPTGGLNGSSA